MRTPKVGEAERSTRHLCWSFRRSVGVPLLNKSLYASNDHSSLRSTLMSDGRRSCSDERISNVFEILMIRLRCRRRIVSQCSSIFYTLAQSGIVCTIFVVTVVMVAIEATLRQSNDHRQRSAHMDEKDACSCKQHVVNLNTRPCILLVGRVQYPNTADPTILFVHLALLLG